MNTRRVFMAGVLFPVAPFRGFYFGVQKRVENMSVDELLDEMESGVSMLEAYREAQNGISSKEVIRFNDCDRVVRTLVLRFPASIRFSNIVARWEGVS